MRKRPTPQQTAKPATRSSSTLDLRRSTPPQTEVAVSGGDKKRLEIKRLPRKYIVASVAAIGLTILLVAIFTSSSASNTEQFAPIEQASTHFDPLVLRAGEDTAYHFDSERAVLSFSSEFSGVTLTVSQQEAPGNLTDGGGGLATLARQLNAGSTIDSNKGTVYIASDEEGSGQTAIFAYDGVLVFVRANQALTAQEWQDYINQLEAA